MNNSKQPQVTSEMLSSSQAIVGDNGQKIFSEGVILRKISKFILSSSEDAVMPIPVFFDPSSGKVLLESLPKELREEFKIYNDSLEGKTTVLPVGKIELTTENTTNG